MKKSLCSQAGVLAGVLGIMVIMTGCLYEGRTVKKHADENAAGGQVIQIQEEADAVLVKRDGLEESDVKLTDEEKFLLRDMPTASP